MKGRRNVEKPTPLEDEDTPRSVLRFTPWAWAKLQFFCHHGDTEIGGFGITSGADLLLVEDFVTVKQKTSCVSVEFDDAAVADFFESQVDAGRKPEQFARLWCHTHPGASPQPSSVDEATFDRVFGRCDWAVMFILARGGATYARLRFSIGPGGDLLIPVSVDYTAPFEASAHDTWEQAYDAHICPDHRALSAFGGSDLDDWDWAGPFEELDPTAEVELLRQFEEMACHDGTIEEDEVIL